jgi:hypothetical protein
MKKITLFLILMIGSLGFSQVLPFNFSSPSHLMAGQEGTTTSIISDAGNDVLQIVGGTALYDHASVILTQNVNLADDANNIITFRIKSNVAEQRSHLLKFEQGVGGPATAELAFTTTGTEWQNISLNYPAGLGNYAKIVLFTDFNNVLTGTYTIDDLAGGTNVAAPVVVAPTVAAPTPPVRNATDVINLYSSAYTEIAGTNWNPNWGQATVATEIQIAGNATRKMASLNYQGAVIANAQNVSTMTNLHLDVWTPDCNSFSVFLISPPLEGPVVLTPTLSGWNSFDIPLSSYTVPDLNAIKEMKFVSGTAGTTVYMDNIYFWKPAPVAGTPVITGFSIADKTIGNPDFTITAPTSNSPGAFSYTSSNTSVATISGNTITLLGVGTTTITANQAASGSFLAASVTSIFNVIPPAAPLPTLLASEVVSMYGETYPNTYQYSFGSVAGEPDLDLSTDVNLALKYNFEVSGYGAGYTATDVSAMQYVHFDYYTTNSANFKFVLISSTGEKDFVFPTSQPIVLNTWKSVNIPMSYFTGLGFNPATWFQFKFDVASVTPGTPNVVYIDNIYFTSNSLGVKDFTSAEVKMYPNPTASLFTIEANDTVESVSLFNVLGQEVLTNKFNANTVSLDISNLQTGVYVVKAVIGGVSSTSRIVKK